jgi:3-oxoacyl-[acyl-carrier protein] reductase
MDLGLSGRCVLITGASGGIGRALAETFAAEGASLALCGRERTAELEDYVAGRPWRDRARCFRADLAAPGEVDELLDRARSAFGRVDVAVANAGRWPREDRLLHEIDEARVRATLDDNLLGPLWTARAFLRTLAATGPRDGGEGASLCFVGSTAGRFGERGHSDYAAAKSALVGLMLSLKNEIVRVDPFARVNLVEPGWTVTHQVREALERRGAIEGALRTMALRQLARASDVARAVAFLSSPAAARHLTGQTVTVAGGMEGRSLWGPEDVDEAAVRGRARS